MQAHAQQITPRNQPHQFPGCTIDDWRAANLSSGHTIGQLYHELVGIAHKNLLRSALIGKRVGALPAGSRPA